ncbi:UNVERIFIED_CONTAM: hypothetical protein RMT77_000682 [Armadillidium vulgare]
MKEPYFLEASLPQYVKKYMQENKVIDIEDMTIYLMKTFKEFKFKKKRNFMKSVEKAYKWESYKMAQETPTNELSDYENFKIDNGDNEDIIEVSVKKDSSPKKKNDFDINKWYKSPSAKSSEVSTENDEVQNPTKNKKRKRDEDIDSLIINELKKSKGSIEKLTFQHDLSSFKGLKYLPVGIGRIAAFFVAKHRHILAKSFLLAGPLGSGKSMIIEYFASRFQIPVIRISTSSLNSGPVNNGRNVMKEAVSEALANEPCILHIPNIDDISKKEYGNNRGIDRNINEQIVDAIQKLRNSDKKVLLVAEARNLEQIDSVLHSKFQKVINFPVLCQEAKLLIIKQLCEERGLDLQDINLDDIVSRTTSFVAGDLIKLIEHVADIIYEREVLSLSKEALDDPFGEHFTNEYVSKLDIPTRKVTDKDFYTAFSMFKPTLKEKGFPTMSNTKWEDIGGLEDIKQEIREKVLGPIKYKDEYARFGIKKPVGILMYGPPGCGKTILTEAVANEAGVNLCSVRGPELLNMYQGESERGIREVFQRAASVAPCIIFFDEFDSLCQNRVGSMDSGSRYTIVNTLLAEMNGFGGRNDVYVMAATNKPEVVDPAMLRPGRIDTTLYIGLPDAKGRAAIMKTTARKEGAQLGSDVDLENIALSCENYSGADCAHLVELACRASFREAYPHGDVNIKVNDCSVYKKHFQIAINLVEPSVSSEDREWYLKMKNRIEDFRKGRKSSR